MSEICNSKAILLIAGIIFISFNLRAPITAVGSLVQMIKEEYLLSNAVAGIITTIPLIAFAVVSPFVAKISSMIGAPITMMAGLGLILVGLICRSYASIYGLFIGTAIIGIGIAIGNVIIPGVIKRSFPENVGLVTSIYTTGMCVFAAVGAGISVPIAEGLNLGWKHSLACWIILTVITIFIWIPQVITKKGEEAAKKSETKTKTIWASKLAWWVTLFMGIQSLVFYSLVAWLPTIVTSKGMTVDFASVMALVFQLLAIPATLVIPILCDKFKDQVMLVMVTCVIYGAGMLTFLLGKSKAAVVIAVVLMAIGMGGSISLSIAFISLRSPNSQRAAELSGMSQSAGYLLAAVGPTLTGLIYDIQSSWTVPLVIFIVLIVLLAVCGFFSGKNVVIDGEYPEDNEEKELESEGLDVENISSSASSLHGDPEMPDVAKEETVEAIPEL